jgi:hypothetical protein
MPEAVEAVTEIPVFTQQTPDTIGKLPDKPGTAEVVTDQKAQEAPADKAPAAAPEKSDADTDEQPDRPGKSRYQRRLDKAYRRAAEAEARAKFLQQQIEGLKPKETPNGAPRLEDFSDVQEYAKAYAKFEADNAVKGFQAKQTEENFKRLQESLATQWESKASRADKKYDDFEDVVGELIPDNPVSVAIMQAENGEDIAYYLATHLEEAHRIAGLDPLSQAREIGRLESKLLADPPKPKTVSKAPAPITPVSGTANPTSGPTEDDDIGTWIKKRQKEVHGR